MRMAIAFKEWSIICDALGSGRQTIILRKGGIAEGKQGFEFRHPEFYLFPTAYHQQAEHVRIPVPANLPAAGDAFVPIQYFCRVEETRVLTGWPAVRSLEPFHIWRDDVIRERFEYEGVDAIHLALCRVYRLDRVWDLKMDASYRGCLSWIDIENPPPNIPRSPVLSEPAWQSVSRDIRTAIA